MTPVTIKTPNTVRGPPETKWVFNLFETVQGNHLDYESLAKYHYCPGRPICLPNVFKIVAKQPYRKDFPDPVAVVVYANPLPQMPGRNAATAGYFRTPRTQSERLRLINQKIRYLSRIIVDPRFRKLGIATKLIKETIEQLFVPIVETLTPLDFTQKLFAKCGFKTYFNRMPAHYVRLHNALQQIGLNKPTRELPGVVHKRITRLSSEERDRFMLAVDRFLAHWERRNRILHGLARTKYFLDKLNYPPVYLCWFNPKISYSD